MAKARAGAAKQQRGTNSACSCPEQQAEEPKTESVSDAGLRLLLGGKRSTGARMPTARGPGRVAPFLPIAADVRGVEIIQAVGSALAARMRMLDLPGAPSVWASVVAKAKPSTANVASAVGPLEYPFKPLVWHRRPL